MTLHNQVSCFDVSNSKNAPTCPIPKEEFFAHSKDYLDLQW